MTKFHTIEPVARANDPRNTLRRNLIPSTRGAAQFREYTLSTAVVRYRTDVEVTCETAEATGFSGTTSFTIKKSNVDFIGGLSSADLLDPTKTQFIDPLITAQLVWFKSETPPTRSAEHLYTLPFTEIDTNGNVEQAANIELKATLAAVKGDTDDLDFVFNWYRRSSNSTNGRLIVQIWDLKAGEDVDTVVQSGTSNPTVFYER